MHDAKMKVWFTTSCIIIHILGNMTNLYLKFVRWAKFYALYFAIVYNKLNFPRKMHLFIPAKQKNIPSPNWKEDVPRYFFI